MNLIAALPACLHASLSAFGMTRGEGSIRACIIRAGWTRKERREMRAAPSHLFALLKRQKYCLLIYYEKNIIPSSKKYGS
jgi:hypothetical protein